MSPEIQKSFNRLSAIGAPDTSTVSKSLHMNPVIQGNQNTINMLQHFQKSIISIATQITQMNSKQNSASTDRQKSNRLRISSSVEGGIGKSRNLSSQFQLPSISKHTEGGETLNLLRRNDSAAHVSRSSVLGQKPPIVQKKTKSTLMKKMRIEKDYQAKNNPTFCRCKDHLSEVNEINSYLHSISSKQLDFDSSKTKKQPYITRSAVTTSHTPLKQRPQTNITLQEKTPSVYEVSPVKPMTSKMQESFGEDKSSTSEQKSQFRELLRERIRQANGSSHGLKPSTRQSKEGPTYSNKYIRDNQARLLHGLNLQPVIETNDPNSFPESTQSSAAKMLNMVQGSVNQYDEYDDRFYEMTRSQREAARWQDLSIIHDEESIDRFYKNYKQIDKIKQIEKISPESVKQMKNPLVEYLKKADDEYLAPHLLAFKKSQNPEEFTYNLKSFYINNSFAKAFSQNLKSNSQLSSLILVNNKLSDEKFQLLLLSLPLKLQRLDVSNNPQITLKTYRMIKDEILNHPQRIISYLSFEGNLMADDSCKEICEGIKQSNCVKVVNLSKNNITDVGAQYLSEILTFEGTKIVSLLIHWNQIRGKGAVLLAKAIKQNQTLQIFDASFNSFGSGNLRKIKQKPIKISDKMTRQDKEKLLKQIAQAPKFEEFTQAAYKFKKALMVNNKIAHLDLSFNSFKKKDIEIIGEGLKSNHSILGLHMMGNEAKVDELGFVEGSIVNDHAVSHVFTRIPALLRCPNIQNKKLIELKVASNCWICEGWAQMEFRIDSKDPPFLHLSFEQFKPQKMEKDPTQPDGYILYRMIPSGSLAYFFSTSDKNTFTDANVPSYVNLESLIQNDQVSINVPKINYIEHVESLHKVLSTDDLKAMKALPRPEPIQEEQKIRPKSPWSLPKSLFAQYKYDTDEHLANCFDFDWRCSKIDKLIKSIKDKERIYAYLLKNYRAIREAYKYFSALGPSGNIFSIGTNVFSDIIYNCTGLLDSKNVKLSDVDLEFISTKAGNQFKTRQNPDRQLIRFQFMEIFVRLAIDKYYKSKIVETHEEAVVKVFEENVLPYFRKFNSGDFRWQRLWNEPCDIVLKKNLKILKEIYGKHSGRESVPGEPKHMCMNEFIDLVTMSGVIDDNFGAREIGVLFNLSMMTQIDEINKERHFQMQFIEFIEAMSRVADRVIANNQEGGIDDTKTITDEYVTLDGQGSLGGEKSTILNLSPDQPLDKKIQEYINRLALTCMGEEYAYQYRKKLERDETLRKRQMTKLALGTVKNQDANDKSFDSFGARINSSLSSHRGMTPMVSRKGNSSSFNQKRL